MLNTNFIDSLEKHQKEGRIKGRTVSLYEIELPEWLTDKWQNIVDTVAEIMSIPAALIMRVRPPEIEVFITSLTEGNPYDKGASDELPGLYCETVMASDDELLVPNALEDPDWDENPDIKLGMISYLGVPIKWPDGAVFGTICVLDNKTNAYNEKYKRVLYQFKELAETHLALFYSNHELNESNLELTRQQEELVEQKQALEEANKTRELFLSVISHDLKNPFHEIKGLASILAGKIDKLTDEQIERYSADIVNSTDRVSSLLENLTKWSALKRGKMELSPEPIQLQKLVDIELEAFGEIVSRKSINLVNDVTKEITVNADPAALRTILRNIIGNAMKFTDMGGVVIIEASAVDGTANITVSDTGVGMTEDEVENLPNPEKRVLRAGTSGEGGTGLGLHLSEEFINLSGGRLKIESNKGEGTTVSFNLPTANR